MSQKDERHETTTYTGEFPKEPWKSWKDTVPRSRKLADRIAELVELDYEAREQGMELETIAREAFQSEE